MPPTPGAGAGGEEPSAAAETGFIDLLSPSVRERCRVRRFAPGDVIVREGEAGGNAFILVSGRCDVTVHGDTLNLIHPGELFGEIACLEAGTRTATVRAAVESEVLELEGDALRSELQRSPAMLEKCLRVIAQRVRDISRRETTMRDEHRGLRKSLESLQPRLDRFKDHPVLTVEVRWQPMSFASGDYYDVLELSPDRLLFALGDVMGHGAPTTPIVGMMRGQLHEFASLDSRPHEVLAHLHRHMLRHGQPNVFMTLTLLILDLSSFTAEFSVGGPPCPLLHRNGRCVPLTTQPGWTLGYPFGGVSFQSESLPLAHGDTLLFYTDGLSDAARGPDLEHDTLGADGLATILTNACAAGGPGIADAVCAGVEQYRAGWPVEDDATAFVVSVR
jgi:sigma-B regulation protein RsbU (phosphoserine phosphatase)